MQNILKLLVQLQQTDTKILEKRRFIDRVPMRISEVDEPLKNAKSELEKMKQRSEAVAARRKDRERAAEDINEKIKKMKARTADIKTNKEYQAHIREIEASEKETAKIEEQLLRIMEEIEAFRKDLQDRQQSVQAEEDKLQDFRKELAAEAARLENELVALKAERVLLVSGLDADIYNRYHDLLLKGKGSAVSLVEDEICRGCDMNIPPQLFVEVRKGSELVQCPQCDRILYCEGD